MRKIRDILRLRLASGLSIRQINASTKVSLGAIQKLLSKATALELSWPLPDDLNDVQLARLFYPDADTGEIREAEIFVAVLGASNKTYAEATHSQQLPNWLGSHVRMFDYFGGCTTMVVYDYVPGNIIIYQSVRISRYEP